MRRILLLAAAVLFALPLAASEGYSFHLKITDGRTGLLANPDFEKLHMTAQQLEHAAHDRVMLFDQASGTHWRWMMLTWPDKPLEQGINSHGAAKVGGGADVAFSPAAGGNIHLRCLRTRCHAGGATLAKGESKDFPADSDFKLTFE